MSGSNSVEQNGCKYDKIMMQPSEIQKLKEAYEVLETISINMWLENEQKNQIGKIAYDAKQRIQEILNIVSG